MNPQLIQYSEQPELWDSIAELSSEVWPEYNRHGDMLGQYWLLNLAAALASRLDIS